MSRITVKCALFSVLTFTALGVGAYAVKKQYLNAAHVSVVQQPDQEPAEPKKDKPNRMDERGCCVLKTSAIKNEWDYRDNEIRRECVLNARKENVDWDFYPNKSCEDVQSGK